MHSTRRRLLAGTVGLLGLAGCLADGPDPRGDDGSDDGDGSDDDDGDDGDGSDGDEESDDGDGDDGEGPAYGLVDHETVTYALGSAEPAVETFHERAGLEAWIGAEDPGEEVDRFVAETEFDRSMVVAVRIEVRNLCYGLELADVGVEDDRLAVETTVVDEGDGAACAQAIQYPTLLVRATFEDAVPGEARVRLDGERIDEDVLYPEGSTAGNESDPAA